MSARGEPEIAERPSGLRFRHEQIALDVDATRLLDIRPWLGKRGCSWIALKPDGMVQAIDLERPAMEPLFSLADVGLDLSKEITIHVSSDGALAAVVNTKGQFGVVVDLATGAPRMRLERDTYRIEHSVFPIAFFEHEGRVLLVHSTAWNRLDVSDPRTGEIVTSRALEPYREGEGPPEHYLDYFHCGLSVSPDSSWIVDNGWIWHPYGSVTAWSLRRWVEENVWESEDGPSKKQLCGRSYYWDGPLCWTGPRTLAVWGYGTDDENLVPAARIFDVEAGEEIACFAGPLGDFYFDEFLFSCSPERGTAVWDCATGERLLLDPGLKPTRYHPGAKRFVTPREGGFQASWLAGSGSPASQGETCLSQKLAGR